jgi:hypothetical protein
MGSIATTVYRKVEKENKKENFRKLVALYNFPYTGAVAAGGVPAHGL